MRNRRLQHAAVLACVLALGIGGLPGVIRTVDDNDPLADFDSIQAAIGASESGDVIQVACGLYLENINMKDQVSVLGAGAQCAILDGGRAGSVVTFDGVSAGTELSGFTIRFGESLQGGGIFLDNSAPTISRNIIRENRAVLNTYGSFGYGGGISAYQSSPRITNNLFVGNLSERSGAAVDMYYSYPVIVNNTMIGNESTRPGQEAGVGGAIYALSSGPTISSNVIHDNMAEGGGGGIDLVNSTYTVEFNNLSLNLPTNWSCQKTIGSCANPTFPPPPGNSSADARVEGNSIASRRCLRSSSPAVDGGPLAAPSEPTDFFGRPRVQDGDFDGTATVNQGYCESDEVTRVQLEGAVVSWDASPNPSVVYNLYRGVLSELLLSCGTACVYSQDPATVPGAERHCNLVSPSLVDPDLPSFGEFYYYLVSGEDVEEASLGWLGNVLRTNDNPCP